MKMKRILTAICLALILCFAFCACGDDYIARNGRDLNLYEIDATYDETTHVLSGCETFHYRNDCDVAFSSLKFHLYPNAYRQGGTLATKNAVAFSTPATYGGITLDQVSVNGEQATYRVTGTDYDILEVELPQELYTGESVSVQMTFQVQMPRARHRLGFGEHTVNFGNWYPVLCATQRNEFVCDPYYSMGDPFYSEMANYHVTLRLPKDYVLASGGNLTERTEGENEVVYRLEATSVRDFAFLCSKEYQHVSAEKNGTTVHYYYFNDQDPQNSLQTACDALATFSDAFGKYPYEQYTVAEAEFHQGGMEYPNLSYITTGLDQETYRQVIVHETAHQWWYGLVGNDEVRHAWMDEGLAEFSTAYFYEQNPSYNVSYQMMMLRCEKTYTSYVKVLQALDGISTKMERTLGEFPTEREYTLCTYHKGMLLFDSLRQVMGDKFFIGLRKYFEKYRCKNAEPEDMIACFERAFGGTLSDWFDAWLQGNVVIGEA